MNKKRTMVINTNQCSLIELERAWSNNLGLLSIDRVLPNGSIQLSYCTTKYLNVWC